MTSILEISIEEEIKKNPELKQSDIDHLREWCKSQSHLPNISDSDLILFLHSNYYGIESTKTTIDTFYTIKTHTPELFDNRDPIGEKNFRKIFYVISILPLKQSTKEGSHIFLSRFTDPNSSNFEFINAVKYFLMVFDLWLYSSGTMKGHVLLFDVQHVSMGHATRISLSGLKKFLTFLQEGLPVRMKGLHFMNANVAMNVILRMMKPFLKKELTEILYVHSTLESLGKHLPIEALPNELGGKAGPVMEFHEAEIRKLEAHRDWFLEEQMRARVDESKRPKKVESSTKRTESAQRLKTNDID